MATSFADLGVSKGVVLALKERGVLEPFPIQAETIQAALAGRDICGKAPTGSGKTLAFGIPVVDLAHDGGPWEPAALILSPTRELATQIKDEIAPLAKAHKKRVLTVFGGTNIERDIKQLERGVDILVACPGRLEDLISRRCCDLRRAGLVVVDEADRMADMGFLPTVKRILDQTPDDRHTLLFSATLDGDVDQLIKRYQNDPLTVEVEAQVEETGDVEHSWYVVEPHERIDSAVSVLERYWSSIVFCRTRRGCDRVAKMFNKRGLKAVAIHGDRSQNQRERALADFTSGKAQVLVATDVAARGIHVDNVSLVMHYDPAGTDKDYIHRSGRTGRAGADGRVISMVVEDKRKIARQLQKDLGVKQGFDTLDASGLPDVVERPAVVEKPREQNGNRGGSAKPNKGRGDQRNRNGSNRGSARRGDRDRGGRNDGDRRARDDRDNRDGRNRNDRGGRNNGRGRARNDRDGRGRNDDDGRGRSDRDRRDRNNRDGRDRDDRDKRGGRGRNDRDNRQRGDRDNRGRYDRDERDGRGRNNGERRGGNRQRRGKNDWYPPEKKKWDRDDRGGSSGGRRNGPAKGRKRDEPWRDRDEEETPHGGSNSTPRKPRAQKGRHADRNRNQNKGKRRPPSGRS